MLRAIIELELKSPYSESINILNEFNKLWGCILLRGGTLKEEAIISIPIKSFKTIFGVNPLVGEYDVPKGTEHFISSLKVIKITVE